MTALPPDFPRTARRMAGQVAHHAGRVAEGRVADHYRRSGHRIAAERWRGRGGEIDLVMRSAEGLVFIEVKAARSHAEAAERLRPRQIARLCAAAEEFMGGEPEGLRTPARFDVALVDGTGRIEILENALM